MNVPKTKDHSGTDNVWVVFPVHSCLTKINLVPVLDLGVIEPVVG